MFLVIIWKDKSKLQIDMRKKLKRTADWWNLGNDKEHVAEEKCTYTLLVPGNSLLGGRSGLAQGRASAGSSRLWHEAPQGRSTAFMQGRGYRKTPGTVQRFPTNQTNQMY